MVQHLLGATRCCAHCADSARGAGGAEPGPVATVNLNEFLALDLARLARNVAGQIGLDPAAERLTDTLDMLAAFKPIKRHEHVARALYDMTEPRADRDAVAHALAIHPSDVARSWAAQWVMFSGMPLSRKLHSVRRFAADPHFGVREIAWMAVRARCGGRAGRGYRSAAALGARWRRQHPPFRERTHASARRVVRADRGLKAEPWRALPLLEPLKADSSRYVQNSVANWLNDAGKSQPEWVHELCERWGGESASPATAYIIRRASRSLPSAN